jgi:hypothetical protein
MEVLIAVSLVVLIPVKLAAWFIGMLVGNIVDGFHRGYDVEKPYGEVK